MSFYRAYDYPLCEERFKHIYFKSDRGFRREDVPQKEKMILDELKLLNNLSRTRRTIRDILLCNRFDYFCTYTLADEHVDVTDFNSCSKKLREVFHHYVQRYSPNFQYLIVPEYGGQTGRLHFHGMVRGIRHEDFVVPDMIWKRDKNKELIEVPNTPGYVDWPYYSEKLGHFNCSAIKNYEACARYVSKYITKDMIQAGRGKRLFMASKNLRRPELVFEADNIPLPFVPGNDRGRYSDEFVCIAHSKDSFGLWDDLTYGECCSDLHDLPEMEEDIFEDGVKYEQLRLSAC